MGPVSTTFDDRVRASQSAFLDELRRVTHPRTIKVCGVEIIVNRDVFSPKTDALLLADHLICREGDRVLDLTTGSGVHAVLAGRQGAHGAAGDISSLAVRNAAQNFAIHGVDFAAVRSDGFEGIPRGPYDLVVGTPPYAEGEVTESLEYAYYGARRFVERMFENAGRFLAPRGTLLITQAEWGDLVHFESTAKRHGFELATVDRSRSDDGERWYRLYRCALNDRVRAQ